MGIAGAARRLSFRATAIGAVVLALFAWTALLVPASDPREVNAIWTIREQVWLIAAICAVLSVSSYAGALAGGETSEEGHRPTQFSLRELFLVFIPVAVFFGYLGHLVQ